MYPGVFIAALVIYFRPDWAIVDPICTFVFSLLVLGTTVSILRSTLAVIMEAAPPGTSYSSLRNTLLSVPGIQAVHNLRSVEVNHKLVNPEQFESESGA